MAVLGVLIVCFMTFMILQSLRTGKIQYLVSMFHPRYRRPPVRVYDRRTQPWQYWIMVTVLIVSDLALAAVTFATFLR